MPEQIDPELLQKLADEYDTECQRRHDMGAEKYGPVRFLEVNSLQEAMNEIVDLANYARYTWMKFALMIHLDPSTESNLAGFEDEEGPVEVDQPTDNINSNQPIPDIKFFNPYRRERNR